MAPAHPLLSEPGIIVAHRGDRAHAPENTVLALEHAVRAGADAFEIDVRATADGHLVLCHDPTVDRTTDHRGAVDAMTLTQIRECNAGARWSPDPDPERANGGLPRGDRPFASAGARMPTLDDVLGAFPRIPMIIEAKTERAGHALVPLLERHNARDRVLIGAFEHGALLPARRAGFRCTASRRELLALLPRACLGRPQVHAATYDAIAIPPRYLGMPVPVRGYVRVGARPVLVWTVNHPAQARRFLGFGVAGIVTDDPGAMANIRG